MEAHYSFFSILLVLIRIEPKAVYLYQPQPASQLNLYQSRPLGAVLIHRRGSHIPQRLCRAAAERPLHIPPSNMAKVLRGGKWGNLSRSTAPPARPTSEIPHHRTPADEEQDQPEESGSILCLLQEKKQLGVACYDLSTNEIHISKASCENGYSNAALLVSQVDARVIVMPKSYADNDPLMQAVQRNRSDDEFKNGAKSDAPASKDDSRVTPRDNEAAKDESASNDNRSSTGRDYGHDEPSESPEGLVSFLPNSEFGLAKSTELCGFVNVRGMPCNMTPEDRFAYLSHLLGEDDCILRAVGGLLSFVLQNGVLGTIGEDSESIQINNVCHRNYFAVMKIGLTTLRALHVFSNDTHPAGHGSMQAKEGLSLYGILKSHVKTGPARKLLKNWLLYPTTCLETIKERQFVVEALRRSSNSAVLLALKDALRGVKNVPGVLWRLRKRTAGVNDWKALYSSLKSFVIVQDTLRIAVQQNDELLKSPLLAKCSRVAETDLRESVNWIDAIVDFEESTASGRMVVAHGFSEEIDEMKRCYSGLDDFLTTVGIQEHKRLLEGEDFPPLTSLHFTYQPQIGYLIALPERDCDRIGMENLSRFGLSFVFSSSDQGYHFKNYRCKELDDELGDIHGAIVDLEEKSFRHLEDKVFSLSSTIFEMAAVVRELDCLQALAFSANEYSWTKPNFSADGGGLFIEDGRHPLMEFVVSSFVPNSTNLKCGDVQILTGPNYSGKSVYLTQVALIVVLAHVGSFVPAKKAIMTIIDNIHSRISSFESVCYGQSSFFIDSCQVSQMLSPSQGRSLQLIDEYGKGTSEVDGMALLTATLLDLLRAPVANAPFCLCTTHFVEILRDPVLPMSNPRLSVFSMDVIVRSVNEPGIVGRRAFRQQAAAKKCVGSTASVGSRLSRLLSRANAQREVQRETAVPKEESEALGNIVRTYRLLPGSVCHESRAFQCALEAGVPKFLLERAAHIRELIIGTGVIEDAVSCEENSSRIRICSDSVRELLSTNYGDVNAE